MMKRLIVSIFLFFFIFSTNANTGDNSVKKSEHSFLYENYFDPGHKQRRGANLGKDRSMIEVYLGMEPSFGVKLNFYSAKHGTVTERWYMMAGMEFDTDLYAKFGFLLNPGKKNKNRSLSNPAFGWWKLWRYVMIRQAVELGYKGQFLDTEENEFTNINYGGLTLNYTLIFDGNFIFDKTTWYFFDKRTARRIRLKLDAGVFLNLDKFNQPNLGELFIGSNESNGQEYNDNVVNDFGDPMLMNTYPVISPFVNFSVGFAF